jgi:hypothetical protein
MKTNEWKRVMFFVLKEEDFSGVIDMSCPQDLTLLMNFCSEIKKP